jgi:hypothetical protein
MDRTCGCREITSHYLGTYTKDRKTQFKMVSMGMGREGEELMDLSSVITLAGKRLSSKGYV